MTKKQCTFCKDITDDCTVWYINNDRVNVSYDWVERSTEAQVYVCKKMECSLKYRSALNETDWL